MRTQIIAKHDTISNQSILHMHVRVCTTSAPSDGGGGGSGISQTAVLTRRGARMCIELDVAVFSVRFNMHAHVYTYTRKA